MKILITGSDGNLGYYLKEVFKQSDYEITALNKEQLDITDSNACYKIINEAKPEIIINCASYTDVDKCEINQDIAYKINVAGVENLFVNCDNNKIKMIHFSSDYVFDGKKQRKYLETDKKNPLNFYGKTKSQAEEIVSKLDNYLIIRTACLYGNKRNDFIFKILQKLKTDNEIQVVDDIIGDPTYSGTLAKSIKLLINNDCKGVYNITSSAGISRYEWAKDIMSILKIKDKNIIPVKFNQIESVAARPASVSLSNEKFLNEFKEKINIIYKNDLYIYLKENFN